MPVIINGIGWTLENIYTEVVITGRHHHGRERWLGEHGARNAEIDCGATGTMTAFQVTTGNDTWGGTPLCLIGTGDGPFVAGMTRFDAHEILVTDVAGLADTDQHYCQLIYGTGTVADAITAGQYSEFQFIPERAAAASRTNFIMPRLTYGTDKVWLRHWVTGENAVTMDFKLGLHEYED